MARRWAAEGSTTSATEGLTHFAHLVSYSGHGKAAKIQSIVTYRIDAASPDR